MKNLLIYFSFFIFSFSLCSAQDTIVLNNGERMGVKISAFKNDEIIYTQPPSEILMALYTYQVNYIKYANGAIYTITRSRVATASKHDSSAYEWKLTPYVLVSGGTCSPFPIGYGVSSYAVQDDATGNWSFNDAGYAKSGTALSVTAGLIIYKGWEMTGMFSCIQNGIDGNGYMTKTAALLIDSPNPWSSAYSPTFMPITNVSTSGTYSYTNYSILYGITKSWEGRSIRFGISCMIGDLINKTPAMTGTATYQTGQNGVYTYNYYTMQLNAHSMQNFAFEMGMHLDIKITKHLFLRGLLEYEYSTYSTGSSYQLVDMNSGNTFTSGTFYGNNLVIALFNATAGLGYKF